MDKKINDLITEIERLEGQLYELEEKHNELKEEYIILSSQISYKIWQAYNQIKKWFLKGFNYLIENNIKYLFSLRKFNRIIQFYKLRKRIGSYVSPDKLEDFKITKGDITIHNIKDIKQYCHDMHLPYKVIYPEQKNIVYPPAYYREISPHPIEIMQPEIYLAELHDVKIYGDNSFILSKNGYCLYDSASRDNTKRYDFIYGPLKYCENNYVLIDTIKKNKHIIDYGVMLSGVASFNYYHLTVEYLPRFDYINKYGANRKIPLLIDKKCYEFPQANQAINLLKKAKQPIIYLEENCQYSVKRLIVPSYSCWNVINLRKGNKLANTDSIISIQAVKYLRDTFLPLSRNINTRMKPKKIYISRSLRKNRGFNESEIQSVLKELDFTIVHAENLTFLEQVSLFSQVEIIVSATGAGLTNIIYAPSGIKIICLMSQKMDFTAYSNIAGINHQKMFFLTGKPELDNTVPYYQAGFTIDPDYVRTAVMSIISH